MNHKNVLHTVQMEQSNLFFLCRWKLCTGKVCMPNLLACLKEQSQICLLFSIKLLRLHRSICTSHNFLFYFSIFQNNSIPSSFFPIDVLVAINHYLLHHTIFLTFAENHSNSQPTIGHLLHKNVSMLPHIQIAYS